MKRYVACFLAVALLIAMMVGLTACSSDDSYRQTLNSGIEKYQRGEAMTKEEYNAVKGFNDWRAKQGEKTYDAWGN
ncbi:MAG: hypothetical protein IJ769_11040 [Clostridia bacterium]|nr:hypothetical protein [Clostridia bacterium]